MKPLEVTVHVHNNRIKERRIDLGLSTHEVAEQAGVTYRNYIELENLKKPPLRKANMHSIQYEWRDSAIKLSLFFKVPLEELFPNVVLAIKKPIAVWKVSEEECSALLGTYSHNLLCGVDNPMESLELRERVRRVFSTLLPREEKIIRMRFGIGDKTC